MSIAIVRFYVGQDMEKSIVNLYNKLMSNYDKIPPGVSQPLVKPRSIDDVPITAFTLWSSQYNGYDLRRVALEVCDELKKDADIAEFHIIGGQKRQLRIIIDPSKLKAYRFPSPDYGIPDGMQTSFFPPVNFLSGIEEFIVETGGFLANADEVGNVVVAIYNGQAGIPERCGQDYRRPRGTLQLCLYGIWAGIKDRQKAASMKQSLSPSPKRKAQTRRILRNGP